MLVHSRLKTEYSTQTNLSFLVPGRVPKVRNPKFILLGSCIHLDAGLIHEIRDLGQYVTYKTFISGGFYKVFKEYIRSMGYTRNSNQGIAVACDPMVGFSHVPVRGRKSFLKVFVHSGIEHVWEVYPGNWPLSQGMLFSDYAM